MSANERPAQTQVIFNHTSHLSVSSRLPSSPSPPPPPPFQYKHIGPTLLPLNQYSSISTSFPPAESSEFSAFHSNLGSCPRDQFPGRCTSTLEDDRFQNKSFAAPTTPTTSTIYSSTSKIWAQGLVISSNTISRLRQFFHQEEPGRSRLLFMQPGAPQGCDISTVAIADIHSARSARNTPVTSTQIQFTPASTQ